MELSLTHSAGSRKRNRRIPRSFWGKAECYPPILVRLLARENRGGHPHPLTTEQIAERSGLSFMKVHLLSESLSWREVSYEDMRRFLIACGVDFCDNAQMRQNAMYLKAPKFIHLRRSPQWQQLFQPLLQRWYNHCSTI